MISKKLLTARVVEPYLAMPMLCHCEECVDLRLGLALAVLFESKGGKVAIDSEKILHFSTESAGGVGESFIGH